MPALKVGNFWWIKKGQEGLDEGRNKEKLISDQSDNNQNFKTKYGLERRNTKFSGLVFY